MARAVNYKELWGRNVFNLTGHPLCLIDEAENCVNIRESGLLLRVDIDKQLVKSPIPGFNPVYRLTTGEVGCLPPVKENNLYIVSSFTRQSMSRKGIHRDDVLSPYLFDSIMDEKGCIQKVAKGLATYATDYSKGSKIDNAKFHGRHNYPGKKVNGVRVVNLIGKPITFMVDGEVAEICGDKFFRSSILYEREPVQTDIPTKCGAFRITTPTLLSIPEKAEGTVYIVNDRVKDELSYLGFDRPDILSPHIVSDNDNNHGLILSMAA